MSGTGFDFNGGQTWALASAKTSPTGSTRTELWYTTSIESGSTATVGYNINTAGIGDINLIVAEYSGTAAPASALDLVSSTENTLPSASFTDPALGLPAQSEELYIASFASYGQNNAVHMSGNFDEVATKDNAGFFELATLSLHEKLGTDNTVAPQAFVTASAGAIPINHWLTNIATFKLPSPITGALRVFPKKFAVPSRESSVAIEADTCKCSNYSYSDGGERFYRNAHPSDPPHKFSVELDMGFSGLPSSSFIFPGLGYNPITGEIWAVGGDVNLTSSQSRWHVYRGIPQSDDSVSWTDHLASPLDSPSVIFFDQPNVAQDVIFTELTGGSEPWEAQVVGNDQSEIMVRNFRDNPNVAIATQFFGAGFMAQGTSVALSARNGIKSGSTQFYAAGYGDGYDVGTREWIVFTSSAGWGNNPSSNAWGVVDEHTTRKAFLSASNSLFNIFSLGDNDTVFAIGSMDRCISPALVQALWRSLGRLRKLEFLGLGATLLS